jgi:hypothetical protein
MKPLEIVFLSWDPEASLSLFFYDAGAKRLLLISLTSSRWPEVPYDRIWSFTTTWLLLCPMILQIWYDSNWKIIFYCWSGFIYTAKSDLYSCTGYLRLFMIFFY